MLNPIRQIMVRSMAGSGVLLGQFMGSLGWFLGLAKTEAYRIEKDHPVGRPPDAYVAVTFLAKNRAFATVNFRYTPPPRFLGLRSQATT